MVVDYERVVVGLKAYLVSKNSHGKRDLLQKLTELEVACQVPEGEEGYDAAPRRPRRTPAVVTPLEARHG